MGRVITDVDRAAFDRDGFLVQRALFSAREIEVLAGCLADDAALRRRAYGVDDGLGGTTEIALWNDAGEDPLGAVARGERLVRSAEALLGDEVYHYHSKITSKPPGAGGTWVWHQDYGYWYKNGCLFPRMLTVAVPLGPMSPANGCLEVLAGSHLMGRIEHGVVGGQTGADPDRVGAALSRLERVAFEAVPGDVMFFHANTLHTSAPNRSTHPRDLLLVAYNARSNDPVIEHHHPRYIPLDVLPDAEITARAGRHDGERRAFLDPADDRSISGFVPLG